VSTCRQIQLNKEVTISSKVIKFHYVGTKLIVLLFAFVVGESHPVKLISQPNILIYEMATIIASNDDNVLTKGPKLLLIPHWNT
jgi:hypothetical protein